MTQEVKTAFSEVVNHKNRSIMQEQLSYLLPLHRKHYKTVSQEETKIEEIVRWVSI